MRFLVDNPLSWRLAERLRQTGHDAIHVREVGMAAAADPDIYLRGIREDRVIITQDTDFGGLMAGSDPPRGCVALLRLSSGRVEHQWVRLSVLLEQHAGDLVAGTIAVITDTRIRLRRL
jgi:predicted nuclease of predicted toxin-antitoxin system